MEIIESFLQGKASETLCEDARFVSEDYIAVIDGVTSKSDFRYEGKTTGKLGAEMILQALETLPADATVCQFLERVNALIGAFYSRVEFPYNKAEKGIQAVCVVYSAARREVWLIGDCQLRIDGQDHLCAKQTDEILADMRSLVMAVLCNRKGVAYPDGEIQAAGRSVIEPWILEATAFANRAETPFGYAVVNGERIPEALLHVVALDEAPHEIILASDGYPAVRDTLEETEAYLAQVLADDPACCARYRSTKGVLPSNCSYDDRTYIRFRIPGGGRREKSGV